MPFKVGHLYKADFNGCFLNIKEYASTFHRFTIDTIKSKNNIITTLETDEWFLCLETLSKNYDLKNDINDFSLKILTKDGLYGYLNFAQVYTFEYDYDEIKFYNQKDEQVIIPGYIRSF